MNVSGENTRVWINERQKRDGGKWNDYSIGVSKKKEDDSYVTVYFKARFTKDVRLPDPMPNGIKMDYDGFMSVDDYPDKDGNIVKRPLVVVTRAEFETALPDRAKFADTETDSFSAAEDDIPF